MNYQELVNKLYDFVDLHLKRNKIQKAKQNIQDNKFGIKYYEGKLEMLNQLFEFLEDL